MSFRQHLCADQYAGTAVIDPMQRLFQGAFAPGGVPVNPDDRDVGEYLAEILLHALCSLSLIDQAFRGSAVGASLWFCMLITAVMTP